MLNFSMLNLCLILLQNIFNPRQENNFKSTYVSVLFKDDRLKLSILNRLELYVDSLSTT